MRWLALLLALAPGMVPIPPSVFVMGDDRGEPDERPAHRVSLDGYALDRDEVSVVLYVLCVAAGRCPAPRRPAAPAARGSAPSASGYSLLWSSPWSSRWSSLAADLDAAVVLPEALLAPVTGVSWEGAAAYCRFVGKRLPSESEWERAARGTDGRIYPWGNDPRCDLANFGNYQGEGRCPDNPGRPMPPDHRPTGDSIEGARDLAGNVWEWVADVYDPRYYARSPSRNPVGPGNGPLRVARGGACCSMFGLPRDSNRVAFPATYSDEDLGFRCAR